MPRETERDIDFALMRRIQVEDAAAFRAMVEKYSDRLLNLIIRINFTIEEAEDIVQETFVRVYKHRRSFNYHYNFSTWIYTISLNLARNSLRRRKLISFVEFSELTCQEAALVTEPILSSRLPQALHTAIRNLPERYRTAFMLRDVQEMSFEQVGEVMGIPLGTVKSRVYRARLILRNRLQPFSDYVPRRRPEVSLAGNP